MIRIFFLSQSSPILELFPFDKITLKSYICTVVTVMAKQCWSQTVLKSSSWGHSVLQTPALVALDFQFKMIKQLFRSEFAKFCGVGGKLPRPGYLHARGGGGGGWGGWAVGGGASCPGQGILPLTQVYLKKDR